MAGVYLKHPSSPSVMDVRCCDFGALREQEHGVDAKERSRVFFGKLRPRHASTDAFSKLIQVVQVHVPSHFVICSKSHRITFCAGSPAGMV